MYTALSGAIQCWLYYGSMVKERAGYALESFSSLGILLFAILSIVSYGKTHNSQTKPDLLYDMNFEIL